MLLIIIFRPISGTHTATVAAESRAARASGIAGRLQRTTGRRTDFGQYRHGTAGIYISKHL